MFLVASATARLLYFTDLPASHPPAESHAMTRRALMTIVLASILANSASAAHWAYMAPKRPPLPAVKNQAWPRNPIDAFVLARLEREGLRPSPEADRVTLLRRVTFDLIGLPPTPQEVDAFLADQAPGAYERVVERLL